MKEFLDYFPVGMLVFQAEKPHKVLYVNEAFASGSGFGVQELSGICVDGNNAVLPDEDTIEVAMKEARKRGCSSEFEMRLLTKSGEYRWHVFKIRFVEKQEKEPVFVMSIWDVNERKQMEEELYVQTERYKLVEKITGELPFDLDVESGEVLVSGKYLAMRGMENTLEHFAKRSELESIIYKKDIGIFRKAMKEAAEKEIQDCLELRLNISSAGQPEEYAWYRLIYKSIPGMDGRIIRVVGRMTNINQEKMEHEQLSEKLKRDSLTGLLNKKATQEEVEGYLLSAEGKSHALLIIDIDDFKVINDTFGHLFGDTVLISVAEKIQSVFRKSDIIGRVGGDEFLVLMKGTETAAVIGRAQKLCQGIQQQYSAEEREIKISCSVGIAFYDKDGDSYDTLFEKADYAMYQAKDAGKNQYRLAASENQMAGFRKRICKDKNEEQNIGKVQDESFLSAAFSLLAHARDLNGSLNLLLERIGERYDLDVVAVLEDRKGGTEFAQTNCWKRGTGIIADPLHVDKYENWKIYLTGFDDRGILCVDDYEEVDESSQKVQLRSGRKIHALVNCRFRCQDGRMGMIIYCNMSENRKWSEFEKETFLEISRIVSVFVGLRSSQIESQNTILTLQSRDPLTGLLNEKAFRKEAQEKITHMDTSLQYAMVYTDIRDFSYVNENFGNEAGNQILREFGKAVSSDFRVLSCRLHSDLFVSLVIDENRDIILNVIEQTLREFAAMQHKKYPQGNMRLVAGVYFIESADEDIDTVIENANLTRKKIKKNTSGSVCQVYTRDLRAQREAEKRIVSEFETTLAEGRFSVYIQPKFLLQSMEMSGGEALVRWMKPDGGMEMPGEFIPVLEKTGYIVELDFYVFEQVLKYIQRWRAEGKMVHRISVNFSRKHFEGKGIYKRICELTDQYQVEHQYIEVEITESLLVSGLDKVRTEMELLRNDGFAVAIDDFGTGYSSLSMLHDIPADIVKIDRSFLNKSDMEQEREFIERIGALIRSVKEEVIFEGIETKQQLEFLVGCGFRYGQGFLYERPIPIDVFEEKYMK